MKILFATDGSDYAAEAATALANLKTDEPIDLIVLTAFYLPEDLESQQTHSWYPTWRRSEDIRIKNHFEQIRHLLEKVDGSVRMLQLEGSPQHLIVNTAEEMEVDLIVVGAKGHSLLDRLLIGSVSESVAIHAPCSVLVVRPDGSQTPEFRNLTLAFDGSKLATMAGKELCRFQWDKLSNIDIVTVAPTSSFIGEAYAMPVPAEELAVELQSQCVRLKDQLAGQRKELADKIHVKLLERPHVGDAIVESATETKAEMIAIGESGHSALGRFLLGSTTKYVLRNAPCSVLIAREKRAMNPGSERVPESAANYVPV